MKDRATIVRFTVDARSDQGTTMQDPREIATILQSSLVDLYGDLERHSHGIQRIVEDDGAHSSGRFRIDCRKESAAAVRAALTWVTPPPYLETIIYRFDVVDVVDVKET